LAGGGRNLDDRPVLAGPAGLPASALGDVKITCLACGFSWKAGVALRCPGRYMIALSLSPRRIEVRARIPCLLPPAPPW